MGLLDDESGDVLGGIAQGIKGGIQGYMDASDRKYKRDAQDEDRDMRRKEMAAKMQAAQTEADRKEDDDLLSAATKGYRVKRDPTTRRVIDVSKDPTLQPDPPPLHPLQQQKLEADLQAMGHAPVKERNQIVKDAAEKGFEAQFDERGVVTMVPTPERIAEAQAKLELLQAQGAKAKSAGKGGGGGGKLSATMTAEFGTSKSAVSALNDVLGVVDSNPDYFNEERSLFGKVRSYADSGMAAAGVGERGETANKLDADLMVKAQVIGKYLEGGKLAEGDIKRYTKMLPQRGDTKGLVQSKVASLKTQIYQKMNSELDTLQEGGFNTSRITRIEDPGASGLLKPGLIGAAPTGLIKKGAPPVAPAAPAVNPALVQQLQSAKSWLANPKNAADPRRADIEAKIQALKAQGVQ